MYPSFFKTLMLFADRFAIGFVLEKRTQFLGYFDASGPRIRRFTEAPLQVWSSPFIGLGKRASRQ